MAAKTIAKTVAEHKQVDVMGIFLKFAEQYDNVFIFQADDKVFIYRSLGRGEWKKIMDDKRFNDFQKEEIVCNQCLLYPDPDEIDWDKEDAGIPSQLASDILTHSYLNSVEKRKALQNYYRSEMLDLDNQITCVIQEAFPMLDLEEIESWDVDKTTKYLSRAEWKLHTLRGLQFQTETGEYPQEEEDYYQPEPAPQQQQQAPTPTKKSDKTIRGGSKNNKLTPDKAREWAEFRRKFPQFAADDIMLNGIQGMEQASVDTTAPALRVGV